MARAKRGGEYGVNGEHYDGGQFLPSSPNTIKGEMTRAKSQPKPRKQEVAPYTWELAPTAEARSIYSRIAGIVARRNRETGKMEFAATEKNLAYAGLTEDEAKDLIDRWNNGERWI